MAKRKAKIGDRVVWTSLDPSIPPDYGTITEISPSGDRAQIRWDDPGEFGEEETTSNLSGASCVRLVSL